MKEIISSLDVGTDTIKLVVGEIYNKKLNILSCTEVKSKGIKKGIVVNPELALESLKELFNRCESVLEIKIKSVLICVPSYFAEFEVCEGYTSITRETGKINGDDIVSALQASVYNRIPANKELITIMPVEYIINESEVVEDPKNMEATRLTIKSVIALTPKKNVYPIVAILDNMGINVADICFNSLADYNEYKLEDWDSSQGAVINIGDEKTEVSVIKKGVLIATEVLDIAGKNIDKDIMYAYNIDRKTSIKLKEKFALANKENASSVEFDEIINKDGRNVKINQYEISNIVYSKVKEILELSKKQINILTKNENSYIIITGGSTELKDFSLTIEEVFGRIGTIGEITELGGRNNKYSSALGLIKYYHRKLSFRNKTATTMSEEEEEKIFNNRKKNTNSTILGKVFGYFFDN